MLKNNKIGFKKNKKLIFILVGLIILAVAVIVYSRVSIMKYKDYEHVGIGIIFKYPENWHLSVSDNNSGEATNSIIVSNYFEVNTLPLEKHFYIEIFKFDNTEGVSLDDFASNYSLDKEVLNKEKTSLNGYPTLITKYILDKSSSNPTAIRYNIFSGNDIYVIILSGDYAGNEKVIKKLLSSIKLREPVAMGDREEEWLVYRNEAFGFEFKYPQDWQIESKLPVEWSDYLYSFYSYVVTQPKSGGAVLTVSVNFKEADRAIYKNSADQLYLADKTYNLVVNGDRLELTDGKIEPDFALNNPNLANRAERGSTTILAKNFEVQNNPLVNSIMVKFFYLDTGVVTEKTFKDIMATFRILSQ